MYAMAPSREHHLFQVGCTLREEDADEALYGGFEDAMLALLWSSEMSDEVITVFSEEGEPIGIWGYQDDECGGVQVWAVGTDDLVASPKSLLKAGIQMRDALLERYDVIYNSVFVGNTAHIDWLSRLGAVWYKSDDPHFLYFEIRK
jgi:hypothetical protein